MTFAASACFARVACAASVLATLLGATPALATACRLVTDGSFSSIADGTSNTIAFGETFCGSFGDGNLRGGNGLPAVLDGSVDRYAVVRRGFDAVPGGGFVDGTSNTIFVGETIDLQRAGNGWTRSRDGTIQDGTSNTVFVGEGNVGRVQGGFYFAPGATPGIGTVVLGDGSVRTITDGTSNTIFLGEGRVSTVDGRRGLGVITDGTSNTVLFEETPIDVPATDADGVDVWLPKGHYRLRTIPGGFGGAWSRGASTDCGGTVTDDSCVGWTNGFGLRTGPLPEQSFLIGDGSVRVLPSDALIAAPLTDLWIEADGMLTLYYPDDLSGFGDNRGGVRVIVDVVDAVPAPASFLLLAAALGGIALRRRCRTGRA